MGSNPMDYGEPLLHTPGIPGFPHNDTDRAFHFSTGASRTDERT